ncbi:MAG TPA: hypothetical protein VL854_03420 [Nitrososphaeraceae archaeon]|nr:hypothetical protein [Nitrososphaeraceae archaeon]
MTRKSSVLVRKDSNSNLVLLDRRMKKNTRIYNMEKDNKVTIEMVHTSFDIEQNGWNDFIKKVLDEYGFTNRKTYVMRMMIHAYTHGFINVEELEKKLEGIEKDIFL